MVTESVNSTLANAGVSFNDRKAKPQAGGDAKFIIRQNEAELGVRDDF